MPEQSQGGSKVVYIVAGTRTPFLKARGKPGPFSAADLGFLAARQLLSNLSLDPAKLGEVITGCVMPSADEANISRLIALRLGCGHGIPAWTVQRNCASGLQALDSACKDIASGRHSIVLAGGTEAMSRAPLLFSMKMTEWLAKWYASKTIGKKIQTLSAFRLSYLLPVIALLKGLSDPLLGLSMGQTAENLVYRFGIKRKEMDKFAASSHHRLMQAIADNAMSEVMTLYDSDGNFYDHDDGLREDSSVEKLANLKPFFDKKYGKVTAGNSSQITDGAAFLLLADATAVKKYNLPVIAKIVDCHWAGVDPAQMGLGPANAIAPLLLRHNLTTKDIDFWEINEAFSAQVIACVNALADADYCKENFNIEQAIGQIDGDRLNVDGGAIAIGHPVGASGARVILHLANTLQRKQAKRGIATLCIGGGQGGAMLIERVTEVENE